MMNNKRLAKSLIANIIALVVNSGISFFLTPYIVNHVGSEAYGFVNLANNFTGYAMVLTVALNSMAGRFITIEYENGNDENVNKYFSSALYGNVLMCLILLLPSAFCVLFLDSLVKISTELVNDIKILFAFVFLSFFITLINATFSTSLFVVNRKDIEARRNIESYIIKASLLLLLYALLKPKVYYVGITLLVTALYSLIANIYLTRRYLPCVTINKRFISVGNVRTLISSGVWNSLTKLSYILTDGLDLLITNLYISSEMMGVLSIAKLLPSVITVLVATVAGVFVPNYVIAFAHGDKDEFKHKIKQSMVISSTISNICLTSLVVIGNSFFMLWVPNEDSDLLQVLSILTIAGMTVNGGIQCVYNIFSVVNKIKINSIVNLISDLGIVLTVLLLLKTTDLGVYAVAGVSSFVIIIRSLCFSVPYAAYCSQIEKWFFYKQIVLNLLALFVSVVIAMMLKSFFDISTWWDIIVVALLCCITSFIVHMTLFGELKVFIRRIIAK